ncbi:MAG: sodium:alanine symporter family protein [Lachnospiraceae bacterium]|nr:sodium:alanine symporter family protein [Lachnospiraceae bacterium]
MVTWLASFLENINGLLWNGPILLLLSATHLFFTIRLNPQRHTFKAIRLSVTPEKKKDKGGLSGFATLATTLAATLGTGNIVGISTAIALGGPGALFWCFLTGLFGMATAYAECYLSGLHKKRMADGSYVGGPMYVLEKGIRPRKLGLTLGKFYAICVIGAAIGAGCTTQASAIADAAYSTWKISPYLTGVAAAVLTGMVILGGIKSIGRFCTRLVPPLSFLYMGACILLLWQNRSFLLPSLSLILSSAFTGRAAGGGFVGSTFLLAARFGIARGLFTNEAGIGTAAIAAGAADSATPERQALISMTAVFWDTIVMCTLTGLTIVSSILAHPGSTEGFSDGGLTHAAFAFLPQGSAFLTLSLMAFALATLVGWCYLGEKGVAYLFGETGVHSYHLVYIVMIYIGAILPMQLIWSFTDLVNAIMIFPNVLALLMLYRSIKRPYSSTNSAKNS